MAYEPEIYSDLSYKPQLNQLGDASKVINNNAIKQAVKTIVLTPPGSRLFEPDFGCGVGAYLFEPLDADTSEKLQKIIKNSLARYEPRILVNSVTVNVNEDNYMMDVEINYLISELQEYDSTKIVLAKL